MTMSCCCAAAGRYRAIPACNGGSRRCTSCCGAGSVIARMCCTSPPRARWACRPARGPAPGDFSGQRLSHQLPAVLQPVWLRLADSLADPLPALVPQSLEPDAWCPVSASAWSWNVGISSAWRCCPAGSTASCFTRPNALNALREQMGTGRERHRRHPCRTLGPGEKPRLAQTHVSTPSRPLIHSAP